MPESDWLNQNAHRFYPFVPSADFSTDAGTFDGQAAFADAGFTLGIASAFEHARDHVYLWRYYKAGDIIRFVFRLDYGATTYDPMRCYEWVFEFPLDAPLGATTYAIPTRITDYDLIGEENPEMGLGFVTVGDLTEALASAADGNVFMFGDPVIEPALLQSNVNTFVNKIRLANEDRPCPPECPCPSSSSGSSQSSSSSSSSSEAPSSSSSSSSSSESLVCEDPLEPEPAELNAPIRIELPNGTLIGAVKLKPGFNCIIDFDTIQNIVTLQSGLERGEGMQCEDLRTAEDGSLTFESCRACGGLIYAVNGHGVGVEHLQLIGSPGVLILPDADNNRIVVRFEEEGVCKVEV